MIDKKVMSCYQIIDDDDEREMIELIRMVTEDENKAVLTL